VRFGKTILLAAVLAAASLLLAPAYSYWQSRPQVSIAAAGACAGWTPATPSGLVAWYKADTGRTGDPITALTDNSGHGYTLTNSGTVPYNATGFNGFPAIDFQAGGVLTTASSTVDMGTGTTGSVFVAGQMLTGTEADGGLVGIVNDTLNDWDSNASVSWIARDATNNGLAYYRNGDASTQAISLATNYRLGNILDGTNSKFYINNSVGSSVASAKSWISTLPTDSNSIVIGARVLALSVPDLTRAWYGPVAEIIIYSAALGTSDRDCMDAYLVGRFSL